MTASASARHSAIVCPEGARYVGSMNVLNESDVVVQVEESATEVSKLVLNSSQPMLTVRLSTALQLPVCAYFCAKMMRS